MNVNVRPDDLRPDLIEKERRRIAAYISGQFGEFGREVGFASGEVAFFVSTYQDERKLHESDIIIPLALILATMPVMRPKRLLEEIGHGAGMNIAVESCMSHVDLRVGSSIRMCERLRDVNYTGKGWLLSFDHRVVSDGKTALTASLDWEHD